MLKATEQNSSPHNLRKTLTHRWIACAFENGEGLFNLASLINELLKRTEIVYEETAVSNKEDPKIRNKERFFLKPN